MGPLPGVWLPRSDEGGAFRRIGGEKVMPGMLSFFRWVWLSASSPHPRPENAVSDNGMHPG